MTTESTSEEGSPVIYIAIGFLMIAALSLSYSPLFKLSDVHASLPKQIYVDEAIAHLIEFAEKQCSPLPISVEWLLKNSQKRCKVLAQLMYKIESFRIQGQEDILAEYAFNAWKELLVLYGVLWNMKYMHSYEQDHRKALFECMPSLISDILKVFESSESIFFKEQPVLTSGDEKYPEGYLIYQYFNEVRKRTQCEPIPNQVRTIYNNLLKRINRWTIQLPTLAYSKLRKTKLKLWSEYFSATHEHLSVYGSNDTVGCIDDVLLALRNFRTFVKQRIKISLQVKTTQDLGAISEAPSTQGDTEVAPTTENSNKSSVVDATRNEETQSPS